MNHVEIRAGRLFHADGIVHYIIAPDTELEKEDIDQVFDNVRLLSEGSGNRFVLVDACDMVMSSNEVRNYAALHPEAHYLKAVAIVCKSLAVKITINFFLKFNKPVYPCRMFNSMDDAIGWINGMKLKTSVMPV